MLSSLSKTAGFRRLPFAPSELGTLATRVVIDVL